MAKRNSKIQKDTEVVSGKKKASIKKPTQAKTDSNEFQQRVQKVAQELFEKSGHIPGRDMDNWFEAEKKVKEETARS